MKFNDYWKIPSNAKNYFSPKQERVLKEKYGAWYILHTILSVIIAFAPIIIFFALSPDQAFDPTTQTGNLLGAIGFFFGLTGSVSIGVGFVNVFMILIKQYLGHWVTIIAITLGTLLDILGLLIFALVK